MFIKTTLSVVTVLVLSLGFTTLAMAGCGRGSGIRLFLGDRLGIVIPIGGHHRRHYYGSGYGNYGGRYGHGNCSGYSGNPGYGGRYGYGNYSGYSGNPGYGGRYGYGNYSGYSGNPGYGGWYGYGNCSGYSGNPGYGGGFGVYGTPGYGYNGGFFRPRCR